MVENVQFVDYQEAPCFKLGRFLEGKGYVLAKDGEAIKLGWMSATDYVGIIYDDPNVRPWYFLGFIPIRRRRSFLGEIHLKDKEQSWDFIVYGRIYVPRAQELANQLASDFGVKITVRLKTEEPRDEKYFGDGD